MICSNVHRNEVLVLVLALVLVHLKKPKTAPLSGDEYDCSGRRNFKGNLYKTMAEIASN